MIGDAVQFWKSSLEELAKFYQDVYKKKVKRECLK